MKCSDEQFVGFVAAVGVWRLGVHMRIEGVADIPILGRGVVYHNVAHRCTSRSGEVGVEVLARVAVS